MKSNKLFIFLFAAGLGCLAFAGLNLFLALNPSLLKPKVQYEIGSVKKTKGSVSKRTSYSPKEKVSALENVYSKEIYTLKNNSSLTLALAGETIEIIGPAQFSLAVISPESKKVFLNFSDFNKVAPKNEFKNILLTYKGWVIAPYFTKNDLEKTVVQEIPGLVISDEETEEKAPSKKRKLENKENLLDELIAAKRPLLKKCYENYLRKNPMATGKLVVDFVLQDNGKVSASEIKDSTFFKDKSFKDCIQDVFMRIKTSPFEIEGGHLNVTYPIEFE